MSLPDIMLSERSQPWKGPRWNFLGGPGAKTASSQAGSPGLTPEEGTRSHILQLKKDPTCCNGDRRSCTLHWLDTVKYFFSKKVHVVQVIYRSSRTGKTVTTEIVIRTVGTSGFLVCLSTGTSGRHKGNFWGAKNVPYLDQGGHMWKPTMLHAMICAFDYMNRV